MDFLKQRRRWFVGIARLNSVLPKIWAFFWALGLLSLASTIVSLILGDFYRFGTPRWFGLLKDFNLSVFVYLYILGNFIQDLDKGVFPLLVLIRIPVTAVLQFICVVMEAMAVLYGLLFPPKGFDVIKK